jgi:molybdopterin molybdotransferase
MDNLVLHRERVLARIRPIGSERVSLASAFGRVLAEPAMARRPAPPFTCSAMDGFAARSCDLGSGLLEVAATYYAGDAPGRPLLPGQAARIFTGAPLPQGADTVVREEAARVEGGRVRFIGPTRQGEHVRLQGEDVALGAEALPAGVRLGARQLGLCAAVGLDELAVFRRPRAAVIATGDEVVTGSVPNSNGLTVALALTAAGIEPLLSAAPDDQDAIAGALRGALTTCDAVLTIGGVSIGAKDFVPRAVAQLGGEQVVHGVPMKPGKPFLFAEALGRPIFGLPGSPSACLVAFEVFVRPALLRLAGRSSVERPILELPVAELISSRPERTRFFWSRIEADGAVRPLGRDAAQVRGPALADALIELPAGRGTVEAGERVRVRLLGEDAA